MSHYNPNASVVQDADPAPDPLCRGQRRCRRGDRRGAATTFSATEISPELVPAGADGVIQSTESIVGPYALQDFNLFYTTRYGFRAVEDRLSCRGTRGTTRNAGAGRPTSPTPRGGPTICPKSSTGCACFCAASSSSASSSARPCRTARRSRRAARCRRAATGARPPIAVAKVWLEELEAGVPDSD